MPLWIRYDGLEAGGHRGTDVIINDAAPVSTDLRFDRTDRLGRDGQVAGQDFITKKVWDLTLYTNRRTEDEAVGLASAWERAWHDPEVRTGRRLVPLEYSRDHETWFRVYGRPALFTGPKLGVQTRLGAGQVDLQFEQLDPLHYSSNESTTRVNVVAASSTDGWLTPFIFPLVSTVSGEPRAGSIINSGDRPAVVRVRFQGPCTNPRVWSEGFEAGYRGTLAHDQSVTLDGREMTAILRGGGRSPRHVAGAVTRKTRLSQLTAPPGISNLWFEADDTTGTSYVDVFWRDAFTSMQ